MNEALFQRVMQVLSRFGAGYHFDPGKRYIDLQGNERERAVAASSEIFVRYEAENFRAILIGENGESAKFTFLISGPRLSLDDVDYRSASPGEALLFYSIFDLKLMSTPRQFYDVAALPADEEYRGHDASQFFNCLEPVYALPYSDDSVCITRYLVEFLLNTSRYDVFIDDDLADGVKNADYISCVYELIKLKSLLRSNTKRQFLDIYNGIENLFFRVYCFEFYQNSQSKLSDDSFYEVLERYIGWRPREIDAFNKIMKILQTHSNDAVERAAGALSIEVSSGGSDRLAEKVAEKIYNFRNRCVHWRSGAEAAPSVDEINAHSRACVEVISSFPRQYFRLSHSCDCADFLSLA